MAMDLGSHFRQHVCWCQGCVSWPEASQHGNLQAVEGSQVSISRGPQYLPLTPARVHIGPCCLCHQFLWLQRELQSPPCLSRRPSKTGIVIKLKKLNLGKTRFDSPGRRKWQPTPVFLPGKCHGQRGLAGYSPWGPKTVRHDLITKKQ